jgi:NADH-quinone oxidoreductase subunit N
MSNLDSLIAILPILIVLATGILVLVCDACIPLWRQLHVLSGNVTLIGIGVAAFFSISHLNAGADHTSAFSGALTTDNFAQACNLILLTSAALASLMALTYLENRRLNLGEYYALVLFATAGAMLMAAANDLIVLFVAIETLSVALYVLAGFARTDQRSEEAALKYFLLGAFAAGFLLYGIALIYGGSGINQPGSGGTTQLDILAKVIAGVNPSFMLMAGIALVLVGLGFKAALVPFHMWTPDVYEGAPTSVTAFMAATAKIGAFAAILRVFNALVPISPYWMGSIQVLAVLTMFGGNLLAVTQDNVKRMLAYSSIAHAGYLMVAVAAMASPKAHDMAFGAAVFYLLAYTLMTMGAFAVLIYLSWRGKDYQTMADLKGLAKTDPPAAYLMLIFMLSLGGVPPTMGFIGKWYLFGATITAGQYGLAIALAFASMISIYYYLKVVWMMCFQEPDVAGPQEHATAPIGVQLSLAVTVGASLLLGVVPGLVQPLMVAVQMAWHP